MLYNESTGKPKVQADVFSLESLIAWLETMPGDGVYCYIDNGRCLLSKYFTAMGFCRVKITPFELIYAGGSVNLPDQFDLIAVESPQTFGAALSRARTALQAAP